MTESEKHTYYYYAAESVTHRACGPIKASALAKLCAGGGITKETEICKDLNTTRPSRPSPYHKGPDKWVELQHDPLVWSLTLRWRRTLDEQMTNFLKDSHRLVNQRKLKTFKPFLVSYAPDTIKYLEKHLTAVPDDFNSLLTDSIESFDILIEDKPLIEDFGLSESDINQLAELKRSINLSVLGDDSHAPAGCLSMLAAATLQVLVAMWAFGFSVGSAILTLFYMVPWAVLTVGIMFTYQKLIRCPIAKHRLSLHPGRLGWILYQVATRGHDNYLEAQELEREVQRRQNAEHWSTMDEYVFEDEIAELYRKVGYKATRTKGSGDGGFDVLLERSSLITLVECKRHRKPVGPSVIRQLFGVMSMEGAAAGIVVCTGGFSKKAREFAAGDDRITLVDLDGILELAAKADAANG
jgi:HJR/Mrr/RecB family endonuclease